MLKSLQRRKRELHTPDGVEVWLGEELSLRVWRNGDYKLVRRGEVQEWHEDQLHLETYYLPDEVSDAM